MTSITPPPLQTPECDRGRDVEKKGMKGAARVRRHISHHQSTVIIIQLTLPTTDGHITPSTSVAHAVPTLLLLLLHIALIPATAPLVGVAVCVTRTVVAEIEYATLIFVGTA